MESTKTVASPDWYELLVDAVNEPGQLAAAHKHFHTYSLANRWLASRQLRAAGLPLLPINTFNGWKNANRMVQKGQKASIALIMPVPIRAKKKDEETGEEKGDVKFTKFMLRSNWFHLNQTAGEEYVPADDKRGDWHMASALDFLAIKEAPFEFLSVTDKRLGVANGLPAPTPEELKQAKEDGITLPTHEIAISPLESHQTFGRLREMARIVLGHITDTPSKSVPTEPAMQDLEAETAAYLCAATLGVSGLEEARMRLQLNLAKDAKLRIPDKCAHRAFSAADKLINAGYC